MQTPISRRSLLHGMLVGAGALALPSITQAKQPLSSTHKAQVLPGKQCLEIPNCAVWAMWIGHSTVLLNVAGVWILTDPVLFDSYGVNILGMTIGPGRMRKPALSVQDIPKPDILLLSHAHLDHMDIPTLEAISERFPKQIDVITAAKTADVIEDMPWKSLGELDWGGFTHMNGIGITALKVKHNGWRWPGEACRANGQPRTGRSYNGYYLDCNGVGVVFGGDTAYTKDFSELPGEVELAIMPIGAYDPYPETHCTPEECLDMVQMMKARRMLPIHHSTFKQSEEPVREPMQRLMSALNKNNVTELAVRSVGGTVVINNA